MRYRVKNPTVVASRLTETVQIGKLVGRPGDYLVHMPDGQLRVVSGEAFEANYVPAGTPGRKPRTVGRGKRAGNSAEVRAEVSTEEFAE